MERPSKMGRRRKRQASGEHGASVRRLEDKFLKTTTTKRLQVFLVAVALLASLILLQGAASGAPAECGQAMACANPDKMCHENRCICPKDRPVEDREGRCLSFGSMGDPCVVDEQCLGSTRCLAGSCACGPDSVSLLNPSTRIYYCHPKRQLSEECNFDAQCPQNAYCSTKSSGCLCSNGYLQAQVRDERTGSESAQCLAKTCGREGTCESEFHECLDNKCFCLATHFDPHTARCYRFGSTGGAEGGGGNSSASASQDQLEPARGPNQARPPLTLMEDLFKHGDRMWLVVAAAAVGALSLLLLCLVLCAMRRLYQGPCFSAGGHKKEYEPNTKKPLKTNHFANKNSINNKSFRRKSELEAEGERASIMAAAANGGADHEEQRRLASSTSTPV